VAKRSRFTRKADQDLQRLYLQGLEQFGPNQADRYVMGLRASIALLLDHPYVARERTEHRPPVRVHPYGSHLIVFRIDPAGIEILRIRHGRENWSSNPAE
jgi:toxin ParE1/3/4